MSLRLYAWLRLFKGSVFRAYKESKVRSERKVCWHDAFDWVASIKKHQQCVQAFYKVLRLWPVKAVQIWQGGPALFLIKRMMESQACWNIAHNQFDPGAGLFSGKHLAITYNKPHRIASRPCGTCNNRHLSSTCVPRAVTFIPSIQKGVINI